MKTTPYLWLFLAASPSFVYANEWVLPKAADASQTITSTMPIAQKPVTDVDEAVANNRLLDALKWGENQAQKRPLTMHEQQVLAKTARQTGQISLSQQYYQALSEQKNADVAKDGTLGLMLIHTDARNRSAAEHYAQQYQRQFGEDAAWQEAEQYQRQTFSNAANEVANSDLKAATLRQYKQAAQQNHFPMQAALQSQHPSWFDAQDAQWLNIAQQQEIAQTTQLSSADNAQWLQQAQTQALAIGQQAPAQSQLQQAAAQVLLDASLKLATSNRAIDAYESWFPNTQDTPANLQAAYAKNLLSNHQHHRALEHFHALPADAIDDDVQDRMIAAYADAGLMSKAQQRLAQWPTTATINDYTHNYRVAQPYHKEKPFWHIRLLDWDGHHRQANALINEYLQQAPANTNALKLKGDLKRWQGLSDDALAAYDEAAYYLHPDEQVSLEGNRATVYLDQDHPQAARAAIDKLPDYQPIKRDLRERLALLDAPYFQTQATFSDTTSPANMGHEWRVQSRIASARSEQGLRFYAEHDVQTSPHGQQQSRAQKAGVGVQWNRYPTQWDIAIGQGTELNLKPYVHLGVTHRFNQHIQAGLEWQHNSDSIPLRALEQDVYANAVLANVNFHVSADVDAGVGLSVNDFDDGNLRQEAYAFISSTLWQKDRWSLKNYSRLDWQKNRHVPQAAYYNPKQAWSYATEFGIQHRYPFDREITLTQVLSGGIGRYHQQQQSDQTTWSVRYSQQWDIQDRYGVGFHMGRKRAIYDGNPEYSNFAGINTSLRF